MKNFNFMQILKSREKFLNFVWKFLKSCEKIKIFYKIFSILAKNSKRNLKKCKKNLKEIQKMTEKFKEIFKKFKFFKIFLKIPFFIYPRLGGGERHCIISLSKF